MSNTKMMSPEGKQKYWVGVILDQDASGMTIKGYCESKGIPHHQFTWWKKQLRLRNLLGQEVSNDVVDTGHSYLPEGWVECKVEDESLGSDAGITVVEGIERTVERVSTIPQLTVETGRFRIFINNNTDLNLLEKVCERLVSLC